MAKPPAPWIGGKRRLAKRICQLIDGHDHRSYIEPFFGMGGIFLRRQRPAPVEVINDAGEDVVNLFRIIQRHEAALISYIAAMLTARAEFDRLAATPPEVLTDIERAARFLYLQKTAFGGKVSGRNFGVSPGRPARFNAAKLRDELSALHERLSGVVIERLDFAECIRRYDRADALFYLDPPYWGCEGDYGEELFTRADFERLNAALKAVKGAFILSLNDTPGVRAIFSGFRLTDMQVSYSISPSRAGRLPARELLISNFKLRRLAE